MVPLLGAIVCVRVTRVDSQSGKLDVILICIGSKRRDGGRKCRFTP